MTETVSRVSIASIKVDANKRIRRTNVDAVLRLAESIKQVGLLNPITIAPDNTLVAGLHRLEACKRLGWDSIPATAVEYADDLTRELAQIDENLVRDDLSELMQGIHHARRKRVYEQLHPETKASSGTELVKKRWNTVANIAAVSSYATDAAQATGLAERTVRQKTSIGEALEPIAGKLVGTDIEDNQAELLALVKLQKTKPDVAEQVVQRLAEAPSVTERLMNPGPKQKGAREPKPLSVQKLVREFKEERKESKREANRAIVRAVPAIDAVSQVKFPTIVIDPPWDWGDEGDQDQLGRARPDYATMSIDQLKAMPIGDRADTDCHIYLWITNRSLPKGFALLEAWGFRYITCLTWVKPHFGMGNYFRGATEQVLFGVKGSQPLKRKDAPTYFNAPRGPNGHSSKPVEFYDFVESCSPGPYLEVFSRHERDLWVSWGQDAV